jgi:hypothetical protein
MIFNPFEVLESVGEGCNRYDRRYYCTLLYLDVIPNSRFASQNDEVSQCARASECNVTAKHALLPNHSVMADLAQVVQLCVRTYCCVSPASSIYTSIRSYFDTVPDLNPKLLWLLYHLPLQKEATQKTKGISNL